ncbi:MAG: ABC transporter permease [Solirubrobacterales bacterium]
MNQATTTPLDPTAPAARSKTDWASLANTALPLIALVALVVYFAARSSTFLTIDNLTVMSGQAGPLLLAALGATFVVTMGSIDLSVGSMALLCGAICAWVLAESSLGLWAIPIGLAAGLLLGAANGIVYAYGRVPSFITTLGSLSIFAGIGLLILDGSPLPFINQDFSEIAVGQAIPHVQNAGLWALTAWAVFVFVGFRTKFGLYAYAIGGDERVARLSGIRINRYKVAAFALSGMTAGLAGVLSVGQLGSGGPTLGSSLLLDSLAAIVVGGTALSGGTGGVHRTLLGVLLITILANGLNQIGVDEFTQEIIKGGVIIIAVAITMATRRSLVIK